MKRTLRRSTGRLPLAAAVHSVSLLWVKWHREEGVYIIYCNPSKLIRRERDLASHHSLHVRTLQPTIGYLAARKCFFIKPMA